MTNQPAPPRPSMRTSPARTESAEVSIPDSDTDLFRKALELCGYFSAVQEIIDLLAERASEVRPDLLTDRLRDKGVARLSDDERIDLARQAAADCGVDAHSFKQTYNKTKKVRDSISHGIAFTVVAQDSLHIESTFIASSGQTPSKRIVDVTLSELDESIQLCRWLRYFSLYLYLREPFVQQIMFDGKDVKLAAPPALPDELPLGIEFQFEAFWT